MATEVVRDLADNIIGNTTDDGEDIDSIPSAETVINAPDLKNPLGESSSYTLTEGESTFSGDVDRWIHGEAGPTNTAVQRSREMTVQRSTLVSSASLDNSGVWYLAAMVLPFLSLNSTMLWRCTPSTVLGTAEVLLTQVLHLCARARSNLRSLAQEQAARDLFATIMDIVLVVYTIGFLVLSMYQASIIG